MAKEENWSQIRKKTDRGEYGDKVDFPDPAAAPLGTDAEAGGDRSGPDASQEDRRKTRVNPTKRGPGRPIIATAIIALIVLVALLVAIL